MSQEVRLFEIWFRKERRDNHLFDMKFYPAEGADSDDDALFREVNRVMRLRRDLQFVPHPTLF